VPNSLCARCGSCPVWVVLYPRTEMTEPHIYTFTCPDCKNRTSVPSHETKMFAISEELSKRGYFLREEV
jgi:hypothetical protein